MTTGGVSEVMAKSHQPGGFGDKFFESKRCRRRTPAQSSSKPFGRRSVGLLHAMLVTDSRRTRTCAHRRRLRQSGGACPRICSVRHSSVTGFSLVSWVRALKCFLTHPTSSKRMCSKDSNALISRRLGQANTSDQWPRGPTAGWWTGDSVDRG